MHKTELIAKIADIADISVREADNTLAATLEHITNALARGETVSLVGFGGFNVRTRASRTGRNPKTGDPITIAASNQVSFKAGKHFKDSINAS